MLSRSPKRAQAGVSIVEMIFVVALMVILLAVAVPSFAGWIERGRVRAAAETIHAGVQLARSEALTRNANVRFTLTSDGSWAVACTATTPECPDTGVIHARSGEEGKGNFTMQINGATPSASTGVTFVAHGRPLTSEVGRIAQVDVAVPSAVAGSMPSRAMRVLVSDFGRTRMCYPHAPVGSASRC